MSTKRGRSKKDVKDYRSSLAEREPTKKVKAELTNSNADDNSMDEGDEDGFYQEIMSDNSNQDNKSDKLSYKINI